MNHASMGQELSAKGRNGDSMLVHMTPEEVGGLQNLAMAAGGSLTINPETGLVEANFLKKLLPTLLGVGLNFILPGSGLVATLGGKAATAGLLVGAGQTALTGDINKGLMAGLGAFGGASLGGALAGKGAATAALPTTKTAAANILPGDELAMQLAEQGTKQAAALPPGVASGLTPGGASMVPSVGLPASTLPAVPAAAPVATAKTGLAGFGQQFGQAARGTMTGFAGKAAPYAAGLGVLDAVNHASTPPMMMPEEEKSDYDNFFEYRPRTFGRRQPYPGGETIFFDRVNPFVTSRGFAEGGEASSASPVNAGTQGPAGLSDLVAYFRTSPGAITASRTYSDGSSGSTGPRDYGFARSAGMATANTGGGGGGGGGDGGPPAIATNTSNSDQMGGTSRANFVEGTQAQINQRDNPYVPTTDLTLNPRLPGTNIDAVRVSGDGIMPDFTLEDVRVKPVDMSNSDLRVSNTDFNSSLGLGVGGGGGGGGGGYFSDLGRGLGGFDRFGQYDPFGGSSMANFGSGIDSAFGGGNYNFLERDYSDYFAKGGEVGMKDGSFVVDARTVSEIGNGSSNAGIEHLARMGGRPVRGRGDGVSDSVPARIGRDQEARVARDEVIFSPEAVARIGGGNHSKGTKKLYSLMDKAHKARKKAGRGQDTKVAKGLGGLA